MVPKIYEAIDRAVAQGISPQDTARTLIGQGWPAQLVNEVTESWLMSHGRKHVKTNFRKWLEKYRRKALIPVIIVVNFSVIVSIISLLKPWPTKIMVDSAFGSVPAPGFLAPYSHTSTLILITSIMTITIFVAGAFVGAIKDYLLIKLSFPLNREIKENTLRHILNIPANKGRLSKGDYIYRQNILTNSLSDYILSSTASIAQSIITVICILIIMFILNAKLMLICGIVMPALYILTRVFRPRIGLFVRKLAQNNSRISSITTESVDNSETIQSYELADRQVEKTKQLWNQNYKLQLKSLFVSRSYRLSNNLIVIFATSAVMYLGGTAALKNQITLGELLIFMTYMAYLLTPVQNLANQVTTRKQKKIDVGRVHEVLSEYEGIENSWEDRHFPINEGRIQLQGVNYSYGDYVVLDNINLTIEPKQKIGIIGPSGSGKSTLLKLMLLFIEPIRGKITIDDIDIQTVSLKEMRRSIALTSQTPQLFNASILENLLDGNLNGQITKEELDHIIDAMGINSFAEHLPEGLNTLAGEGGSNLSGGQKQRVALARALVKKAPILFMDEPTAALDSNSEEQIKTSIASLIKDKTVLLVSHRKALLKLMDVIYVLDNGTLTNVESMGGLDAYLAKMNDTESQASINQAKLEEARLLEQTQKERDRKRLEELEASNAQLQQKLNASSNSLSTADDVTIVIGH